MRELSDDEQLVNFVVGTLALAVLLTVALPAGLVALAVHRWRRR